MSVVDIDICPRCMWFVQDSELSCNLFKGRLCPLHYMDG